MHRSLRTISGDLLRTATYHRSRRIRTRVPDGGASVIGVYRQENEKCVRRLVEPALAEGWTTAWWALDKVAAGLGDLTVGQGPGAKFSLLNEILLRADVGDGWLVVADDDVEFVRGSVVELVALATTAGFALAQPAPVASELSHEITLSRAVAIARRTNLVEIGPVFALGPACRNAVIPFPPRAGMGWGLELESSELPERGCTLGIVDVVTIEHLGLVGRFYDLDREKELLIERLTARGIERWRDAHRTHETWRPWHRRPPWAVAE